MANRIQIRHGAGAPINGNDLMLLPFELGWDTTNKALYINDDGYLISLSSRADQVLQLVLVYNLIMMFLITLIVLPLKQHRLFILLVQMLRGIFLLLEMLLLFVKIVFFMVLVILQQMKLIKLLLVQSMIDCRLVILQLLSLLIQMTYLI